MARPFLLYHWSPADRRKQIRRYGLRPNSRTVTSYYPSDYICLADSPSLAWGLSGGMHNNRHVPEWDLWMVWSHYVDHRSRAEPRPKEFRVHERIFKRDVWFVASRLQDAKR